MSFRHLFIFNFSQEVFVPSLGFNCSELLNLFSILHKLVVFKSVCSIIQFVQEFKEFWVAMLCVCRVRQHINHIFCDVRNIIGQLGFLLYLFHYFLGLLNHLWLGLIHPCTHAHSHAAHHPRLLKSTHSLLGWFRHCSLCSRGSLVPNGIQILRLTLENTLHHGLLQWHSVDLHTLELLG